MTGAGAIRGTVPRSVIGGDDVNNKGGQNMPTQVQEVRDNKGEILTRGRWESMTNVKYENRCIGQHFFSPSTLRYFGSRIGSQVYAGRFFITSEQDSYGAWGGKRRYTIRIVRDNADIDTWGEHGQFASRSGAVKCAERLAEILKAGS